MRLFTKLFTLILALGSIESHAQDTVLTPTQQKKYITSVAEQYQDINRQLDKNTTAYLNKVKKQQDKLLKKLRRKDSTAAKALQEKFTQDYTDIQNKLTAAANPQQLNKLKEYIPGLDTAKTTFAFLEKSGLKNPELAKQLDKGKEALQLFENKMQIANELKKKLQEQRDALKQQFEKLGMVKELKNLNKQVYYYQAQVNEYKSYLKDKKKAQQKALAVLRNTKLYKGFMKKNSALAKLFNVPENYGTPQSLASLQTRAGVQQMLTARLGTMQSTAGGTNPQQYIGQQIQAAQSQMNKLKDKLSKLGISGGGSSNMEMPDFKPNSQKTKKFLDRIEYGMNVQSQKARYYFPAMSDIAITAGYKLNDKSVIGLGISYKVGLGRGWDKMRITHEGVGLRSYADIKAKGSFWLTAGYEMNYLQSFDKIENLKSLSAWRRSALAGLTKKIKITKKKTSNVQLLYDFLHKQNNLTTPALQFRVGWGF